MAAKLPKEEGSMVQDWLVSWELGMANCWASSALVEADSTVPSSPSSCFSADTDPFFFLEAVTPGPSLGALSACDLTLSRRGSILEQAGPNAQARDIKIHFIKHSALLIFGAGSLLQGGCSVGLWGSRRFCNILASSH